jgi:hypothetical protein
VSAGNGGVFAVPLKSDTVNAQINLA